MVGDNELVCVAEARRAETRWSRCNDNEKQTLVSEIQNLISILHKKKSIENECFNFSFDFFF